MAARSTPRLQGLEVDSASLEPNAGARTPGHRRRIPLATSVAVLLFVLGIVGASEPPPAPPGAVHNLREVSGYLANPGVGYQGWTHDVARLPQSTEYRRGEHPQQGGFDWATLNPAEGLYNWAPIDTFLASVAARGQQGSFRVITMNGAPFGTNRLPQWVKDHGALIRPTVDLEPDYRSRAYQQYWGTFVDALARRYDGDPRIAFIDISGYGRFNEWEANPFTDHNDPTGENDSIDSATRRHLIHMFVGGAGVSRVIEDSDGKSEGYLPYDHPGFRRTQLVMPYAGIWASTRYVLIHYPTVGFRSDSLFSADADLDTLKLIKYGITNVWRSAPVVFESVSGARADPQTYRRAAETLLGMGASFLHDNEIPLDQRTLAALVAPLGYRYFCREVSFPSTAPTGGMLRMASTWINTGAARAYRRMGQNFAVGLALADRRGRIIASWVRDHGVENWLPREEHEITDVVRIPELQRGDYTVLLSIVDRNTSTRITLPLRTDRGDRWYPAGNVALT